MKEEEVKEIVQGNLSEELNEVKEVEEVKEDVNEEEGNEQSIGEEITK